MTFQVMALIVTCAGCLLGLRFIFAGGSVLKEWGIEATAGSLYSISPDWRDLSRPRPDVLPRTGGCPLGSPLCVCLVTGGAIALLACLGLFDFLARRVSAGVFRSVVGEAVLAAGFVWVWWGGR
jgi:hypothetical protein